MRVGIIGSTGRLGSSLGKQLLARKLIAPEQLVVLGCGSRRFDHCGHTGVVPAIDVRDLVSRSDIVVLTIRPDAWPNLSLRADDKLVVSFMAGVSGSALARCRGRVVRAMPNDAAEFGASYTPWWASDGVTDEDRDAVRWLLSAIGASAESADETDVDPSTPADQAGRPTFADLMMEPIAESSPRATDPIPALASS